MAKLTSEGIWTNHVYRRLVERAIPFDWASQTFLHPDQQSKIQNGAYSLSKKFPGHTVSLIAKKNDDGRWVVISGWIKPPVPGTKDYYRHLRYLQYRKAGFWGKIKISLLNLLNL